MDPPKADVAFDMKAEIEVLGKHVCSNFGQTAHFLDMLDTRVRDYSLETGLAFSPDSLASIMRRAVDTDTADRKVEEWIRKRESRLRAQGGGAVAGKGPDAMVYGMSAAEAAGAVPPGNAATAPECSENDPWAGSAADPWA